MVAWQQGEQETKQTAIKNEEKNLSKKKLNCNAHISSMERDNFQGENRQKLQSTGTLCHEPCKTGWTDRDAVWDVDSVGFRDLCLDEVPDVPAWTGNFEGKMGWPRTCPDMYGGQYTQSDSAGGSTGTVWMLRGVY